MSIRPVPARAAFDTPLDLVDPSRTLAVWFTEPAGIVVQFARRGPGTVAVAQWLAGAASERLRERFPRDEALICVLDLTRMEGRDPMARAIIVDAARAVADRIIRAVVVPPDTSSRVYLASLKAAASLARVFGLVVSVDSLPNALRSLRAASPSP
jgi:hypothetical protein